MRAANEIEIDLPKASEADAMARLLGEVFSRRDPPAYAVGLSASEFVSFAQLVCPKAVTEGLTIVARMPTIDSTVTLGSRRLPNTAVRYSWIESSSRRSPCTLPRYAIKRSFNRSKRRKQRICI
jgi:hypothetical protein